MNELFPIIPFIVLLLAIAIAPLVNEEWWMKNYPYFAFTAAIIVGLYVVFVQKNFELLWHTFHEYLSFIALLFSLYVVSGGIFVKVRGKSTPLKNVLMLGFGAIMSNFFGTTGAAMLLIRPFIEANKYRFKAYHTVFFIFIVCNAGGMLLPIGDPPLFIGYIKGVDFFWTLTHLSEYWVIINLYLLLLFYIIDRYYYLKVPVEERTAVKGTGEKFIVEGLHNIAYLIVIIISVFITKPIFLREIIMILVAILSYTKTSREIHIKNHYSFVPIVEVAILFVGIFISMIPALEYVGKNSEMFGLKSAGSFYWFTGFFSSFLDNAPTYLNAVSAAMGNSHLSINNIADVKIFQHLHIYELEAISVAAVAFGAMTYIGNGPNFMVKSIVLHKGERAPNFISYILKYSLTILLPIYFIIWIVFFNAH
ncbi:MAG: sodium:proton antiporter [Ignavibacteria bacterium]